MKDWKDKLRGMSGKVGSICKGPAEGERVEEGTCDM